MSGVYPIPTGRASDTLLHARMLAQLAFDQRNLLLSQEQISTGRAFSRPSDAPSQAVRGLEIQRTIEVKEQYQVNITTSQSFLDAADAAATADAATAEATAAQAAAATATRDTETAAGNLDAATAAIATATVGLDRARTARDAVAQARRTQERVVGRRRPGGRGPVEGTEIGIAGDQLPGLRAAIDDEEQAGRRDDQRQNSEYEHHETGHPTAG